MTADRTLPALATFAAPAIKLTAKIEDYCITTLGLEKGKAYALYQEHGTCLKGLLEEGILDESGVDAFLEVRARVVFSNRTKAEHWHGPCSPAPRARWRARTRERRPQTGLSLSFGRAAHPASRRGPRASLTHTSWSCLGRRFVAASRAAGWVRRRGGEAVHDIDLSDIAPDPELRALLLRVRAPRWVFTASVASHARRCLERLGVADLFGEVAVLRDAKSTTATATASPLLSRRSNGAAAALGLAVASRARRTRSRSLARPFSRCGCG